MQIHVVYQEPSKPARQGAMFGAGEFTKTMVGAYGYVRAQHMATGTVTVELLNGVLLHSVRVPSRTWIDETAPTVTGTVDLPPKNSFVFVLLPYGMDNITGSIILFSVFNDRVPSQEARLVEGEENKVVDVLSGNMKTTYDRATGNYKIEDIDDETFGIELNRADKTLVVKDWNGNTISMQSGKVLVNGHLEVLQ